MLCFPQGPWGGSITAASAWPCWLPHTSRTARPLIPPERLPKGQDFLYFPYGSLPSAPHNWISLCTGCPLSISLQVPKHLHFLQDRTPSLAPPGQAPLSLDPLTTPLDKLPSAPPNTRSPRADPITSVRPSRLQPLLSGHGRGAAASVPPSLRAAARLPPPCPALPPLAARGDPR